MYGFSHFGILQSVSAVNAFYFAKSLLAGICIAMLISLIWSQGAKIVLRVSGILFIGFNIYAIAHYDLRRLAPAVRIFYLTNGWLIGMAIPSATALCLPARKTRERQNRSRQTDPPFGPPQT